MLLQRGMRCESFCVSVWLSHEPKTKLSEAVATENVLLQLKCVKAQPINLPHKKDVNPTENILGLNSIMYRTLTYYIAI